VALAALGNSSLYETVVVNSRERFKALHAKQIDVLTQTATHTMGRDVFEPSAGVGFSFSVPFMYTGLAFGGVPEMVDCADTLDTLRGSCRQLKICVGLGTTHELILNDLLAATFLVRTNQAQDHISYINNGTCNVIAKDSVALPEVRMRKDGYFGDYKIGRNIFSREPLALATRDNDSEWTDLVNGVVQLFYTVESEKFLTQELATTILQTNKEEEDEDRHITNRVLDVRVVLQIVSEFGHYGELYERNLQGIVPRDTLNLLNINFDSGLLYSFPFGNLDALGSTAPSSSSAGQRSTTLETIQNRGHLICGVIPRHGFADYNHSTGVWTGLDIEFCKSVSAGVLAGANDTVVFVDVGSSNTTSISSPTSSTEQESTAGREASEPTVYSSLQYLRNQTVDLVAGERVSLQKDFLSNVTFSTPYFYDAKEKAAYAFATRPDDSQWSDFVYWIVMATFYAEENNITSASAISMPAVGLFGEQFKPMLFDCISSVGSYGEIYQRIRSSGGPMLEDRAGGNLLNQNLTGPQQVAIPIS
jgi:general L-amino acid transport system substrate-binding protein